LSHQSNLEKRKKTTSRLSIHGNMLKAIEKNPCFHSRYEKKEDNMLNFSSCLTDGGCSIRKSTDTPT